MTTSQYAEPPPRASLGRRLSTFFHRHPRLSLAVLLALPIGWLAIGYLGSLFVLLLSAFWDTNPFTSEVVHNYTLDNFKRAMRLVHCKTAGTPDGNVERPYTAAHAEARQAVGKDDTAKARQYFSRYNKRR